MRERYEQAYALRFPDFTVYHYLPVLRQLIDPVAELLKREQIRSRDGLRSVFLGGPYVEQEKVLTRLSFFDQIFRSYVLASIGIE